VQHGGHARFDHLALPRELAARAHDRRQRLVRGVILHHQRRGDFGFQLPLGSLEFNQARRVAIRRLEAEAAQHMLFVRRV
jgi:hypothetical protein